MIQHSRTRESNTLLLTNKRMMILRWIIELDYTNHKPPPSFWFCMYQLTLTVATEFILKHKVWLIPIHCDPPPPKKKEGIKKSPKENNKLYKTQHHGVTWTKTEQKPICTSKLQEIIREEKRRGAVQRHFDFVSGHFNTDYLQDESGGLVPSRYKRNGYRAS